MSLKLRLLLIACLGLLALPASAGAVKCVPPGVSGVSQYSETIPGSNCNHPSTGSGGGGGSLPSGTGKQLSKAGAVGQAVKRLVSSSGAGTSANSGTASGSQSGSHGGSGPGSPSTKVGPAINGSGRNPLSALLHPILSGSSSGGVGVLLPVFLVAALVVVLLGTIVRRRLGSSGPQT